MATESPPSPEGIVLGRPTQYRGHEKALLGRVRRGNNSHNRHILDAWQDELKQDFSVFSGKYARYILSLDKTPNKKRPSIYGRKILLRDKQFAKWKLKFEKFLDRHAIRGGIWSFFELAALSHEASVPGSGWKKPFKKSGTVETIFPTPFFRDPPRYSLYAEVENPLSRKVEHNQGWLLWDARTLGKEAHAIEALRSGGGTSRDPAQSFFHSIENKYGGICEECRSGLRWDQKHDERCCADCGLIYPNTFHILEKADPNMQEDTEGSPSWQKPRQEAPSNEDIYSEGYGETFIALSNPSYLHYEKVPSYGHLSDNELDQMVGYRNRKLIRGINDPNKNPTINLFKKFKLGELSSKDYIKLHEKIYSESFGPVKVPLSRIRLDPLIKDKPLLNMVSHQIHFLLEMNPRTKKPKKLLSISSETVLPEAQQNDIFELWREQKIVERAYSKNILEIISDHINAFLYQPDQWNSQPDAWLRALKRARNKISKETGVDYKAVDRALNRIWKKELRDEIIDSRAYEEGDNAWIQTTRWQGDLDLEEEAKQEYGEDWLRREELVWYPLLPLPERRIAKHMALEMLSRYLKSLKERTRSNNSSR